MNVALAPSFFKEYRRMVFKPLALPLTGAENRPIYDANRKLVSIQEHAPLFVAAVNLTQDLAKCGDPAEVWDLVVRAREILAAP